MARYEITIEVKDSDAFQELYSDLPDGERGKWIGFGEYASIDLNCEIVDGRPVILSAKFCKMR
jgi:hypothetical protein